MKRALRSAVAVAALVLAAAACGSNQDPGVVVPNSVSGGPTTTSHVLSSCPVGGPDATTPPSGCLGKDGKVLYP